MQRKPLDKAAIPSSAHLKLRCQLLKLQYPSQVTIFPNLIILDVLNTRQVLG